MKTLHSRTLLAGFAPIAALMFVSMICGCSDSGDTTRRTPDAADASVASAPSDEDNVESFPDSLEDGNDLEFKCVDGVTFSLSDLRGYVVMVDVFQTDCEPCIERFGFLNELAVEHRGGNLKMVGVCLDQENGKELQRFVDRHRFPYPIVGGKGQLMLSSELLGALPVTYLFDVNGKLQSRIIGGYEKEVYEEQIRLVSEMG